MLSVAIFLQLLYHCLPLLTSNIIKSLLNYISHVEKNQEKLEAPELKPDSIFYICLISAVLHILLRGSMFLVCSRCKHFT